MLYLVSTLEYSGIGTQKISVTYGIFSSEEKAKRAINSIVEKLTKITMKSDNDLTEKEEAIIRSEYIENFDIIKITDVDNEDLFKYKVPNW